MIDARATGKGPTMATFVYGLIQSLDGYVDHTSFEPGPALFRHFIEETRRQVGCVYGREMYEVMRYWDEDDHGWGEAEREYAEAWRATPKWVVSRTLQSVGPNATLVADDVEATLRRVKAETDGEVEVAGPTLARSLTDLGLVDEYRIYLHPGVVGHGKRFFPSPQPPLRLAGHDEVPDGVLRLTYVPA